MELQYNDCNIQWQVSIIWFLYKEENFCVNCSLRCFPSKTQGIGRLTHGPAGGAGAAWYKWNWQPGQTGHLWCSILWLPGTGGARGVTTPKPWKQLESEATGTGTRCGVWPGPCSPSSARTWPSPATILRVCWAPLQPDCTTAGKGAATRAWSTLYTSSSSTPLALPGDRAMLWGVLCNWSQALATVRTCRQGWPQLLPQA